MNMDNQTDDLGIQRFNRKTLKYIYEELNKLLTVEEQLEICKISVSEKLIDLLLNENYPKEQLLYSVLYYLSTSDNFSDNNTLFLLISNLVNPLYNGLEVEMCHKLTDKFNALLKFDGLILSWDSTTDILDDGTVINVPDLLTFEELDIPYDKTKTIELMDKKIEEEVKEANWSSDYKWEGSTFSFGTENDISFQTLPTKKLFAALARKKGGWATMHELIRETDKNPEYIRATIRQIEVRLKKIISFPVTIPSTKDDNLLPKPQEGAYRIKIGK